MPINYTTELRLAYLRAAIAGQGETESLIAAYRAFYEGEQGVELSTRQKEYLTGRGDDVDVESFANVCKRVVNLPKDRLALTAQGIAPADESASAYAGAVTDWWNAGQLEAGQGEVYTAALRDGQAALIVGWNGEAPTFTANLVYDGETGLVRFHYDTDGNLIAASKRWNKWDPANLRETGKTRLNLYLDDRIERFEADANTAGGWRLLRPDEVTLESGGQITANPQPWLTRDNQPLGIPVVPFENPPGSELADVLSIQKLLNHGLGTFDIAIDHHAWPILWASGVDLPVNSEGEQYVPEYGPAQMITVAQGGQVGRLDPADLVRLFQSGVLSWLHVLAVVKGWPLFVLDRSATPPSGVALKIMESSLTAQIADKQRAFGGAWERAFDVGRKLHRLYLGDELPGEIDLTWQSFEVVDEQAHSEAQAKRWEAARVPVMMRWREAGYTEKQMEQMVADMRRQDEFGLADVVTGIEQ
jgi:hypothetical protein